MSDEEDAYSEHDSEEQGQEQAKGEEPIGPILPGGHRFDKKLVCIKYPGNVINPEKAIETLGGLTEISETVITKNRRMEVRFRPDDHFCKPACGDKQETVGFLLRVRVKKTRKEEVEKVQEENKVQKNESTNVNKKNDSSQKERKDGTDYAGEASFNQLTEKITNDSHENNTSANEQNITIDTDKYGNLADDKDYTLPKVKVLGKVDSEYRFTNLCDFQYLPITRSKNDPTKDECIYDSIYPVGIPSYGWMREEVPYFLPPAAFSRMDTVQLYVPKAESSNQSGQYVIGKTRKRRAGLSNFINFNAQHVPTKAPKGIETALKVKFLQTTHVEKMRKHFEERPIWSKTALMYVTKFSNEQLKILLPAVAYYFMTGPWRITWIKLGYDPRIDPEAKKYQTLDYRLKAMHGLHASIACKRNYAEYTLPYKSSQTSKAKATVLTPSVNMGQTVKKIKMMNDNVYIYRPGTIPPSRQMFYQYCDVHVKEIQDMLDKYVGPPPGTACHEKLGWLSPGFDDMCREIINKQVRAELRKIMNIPENHPTTLPRKKKFVPTGKVKKNKKRGERKKENKANAEPRPPAMSIIDEDEIMQSEDDEWEDIEGAELSFNENEERNESGNEQEEDNVEG